MPANSVGRATEVQVTAERRRVVPVVASCIVRRGSHAEAPARATARRLARVAARSSARPDPAGATTGMRAVEVVSTTLTVPPVRRALYERPVHPQPREHPRRRRS